MLLPINDDLAKLALQEKALVLPHFDYDVAWRIGTTLRDLALQRKCAVVIDVRRFGHPLFYCASGRHHSGQFGLGAQKGQCCRALLSQFVCDRPGLAQTEDRFAGETRSARFRIMQRMAAAFRFVSSTQALLVR